MRIGLGILLVAAVAAADLACSGGGAGEAASRDEEAATVEAREQMVAAQIAARGIADPAVLRAMRTVPRHRFVPRALRDQAYQDTPLPIGHGQTISQPYIVALMTEMLQPQAEDRVLEVGTGSGYQAAVLAEIVAEVYTIEIVPELAARAAGVLDDLGHDHVHVRAGDGYAGWPERAPFDAIILTAAPDRVPRPLLEQLARGGRLVVPEGETVQRLVLYTRRTDDGPDGEPVIDRRETIAVRFVPMTGRAERD
jgi:protein-L-isoaspartate(D-aspartate) O-methyltransferase